MMDTREPKGNLPTINLCQFLYATTSGSKIGASNLTRQLGSEQSLQCLDPDHLPCLDDEKLGPLSYILFISATPKSHRLAGRDKVSPESPGYKFPATKNTLLVPSKLSVRWHVPFSLSQWVVPLLLTWVWWDTQSHSSGKVPLCHSDRQIPQNCLVLSWGDSCNRKGHARGKGRFYGPCLFHCPFGQGWEQ